MAASRLDGTAVAAAIRNELRPRVDAFVARAGRPPGLGIVLVGTHAPSEIYVRNKLKAAADLVRLPETATLAEILQAVQDLNDSTDHDGILVQDPLPDALGRGASQAVFDTIDPAKDVDGFTAVNAGRLSQNRAVLAPCTPSGGLELLERSDVPIAGSHAVVIGRSDIVGKPMALLLLHRDATVTVCHSRTRDLPAVAGQADILVAAVGRAGFVQPDWVKPGAAVVDVGINRLTDRAAVEALFGSGSPRLDGFDKRGSVLVGDVHPGVAETAGALSPVPGGVGPLTIALLLRNTVTAAEVRATWSGSH
jgi:methylenetetrahydrofolate dehydrogenase (NADP+)/methenyltetrahydrofolate cyclohydrolase